MTPYEQPTDELRQVQHRSMLWNGDWYTFFVVQRKWMVQDGSIVDAQHTPGASFLPDHHNIGAERYTKLREEWRDIPIVSAEEAAK